MTQTINTEIGFAVQLGDKQSNFQHNIETVIIEAVDSSFSLFGETFKKVVYAELETTFKIQKQEIPYRINDFANAIEEICGAGAKLIEMRIIQALHGADAIYLRRADHGPCLRGRGRAAQSAAAPG